MATLNKTNILEIAREVVKEHNKEVSDRLDKQDIVLDKQDKLLEDSKKILNDHSIQLERLEGKMTALYGNGSGRKGILDEIKETQQQMQSTFNEEVKRQAYFRNTVRTIFQVRDAEAQAKSSTHKNWISNIKWWIITPLAVLAWDLLKSYLSGKGVKW